MHQANPYHGEVFSRMATSKQVVGGTDATKQASGLEDQQAQAHGGHKA